MPTLVDFGLATFIDLSAYLYTRCGTPGYVAPEIANLKPDQKVYHEVCDLFSLGVLFH